MAVFLGIADEKIPEGEDLQLSWSVNKIGGKPNWMSFGPSSYPSCQICGKYLYLVTQIYCPLEKDVYHRTLYVFACTELDCWDNSKSWKVFRSQCLDKKEENQRDKMKTETTDEWGAEDWCGDANNWEVGDELSSDILLARKEEKYQKDLKIIEEKAVGVSVHGASRVNAGIVASTTENLILPSFIPRYLFVLLEPSEGCVFEEDSYIKSLIEDYEKQQGVVDISEDTNMTFVTESYEKSGHLYEDPNFHKYRKWISRSPSQCLRYKWNGNPLLLTSKTNPIPELDAIPNCSRCHSKRIFELQLLSSVSWFLREKHQPQHDNEEDKKTIYDKDWFDGEICARQERLDYGFVPSLTDTRLEFGTVFVYSCSQSCWSTEDDQIPPIEEFIAVQPDPDRYITAKAK